MSAVINAFTTEGAQESDPFMNLIPAAGMDLGQISELHNAALRQPRLIYGYEGVGQYAASILEARERITNLAAVRSNIRREYGIEHFGVIVGSACVVERTPVVTGGERFSRHTAPHALTHEVAAWVGHKDSDGYDEIELVSSALGILLGNDVPRKSRAYSLITPGQVLLGNAKRTNVVTKWDSRIGIKELVRYRGN